MDDKVVFEVASIDWISESSIDRHRFLNSEYPIRSIQQDFEKSFLQRNLRIALVQAINQAIPNNRYKEVVCMRFFEGKTFSEVGKALDVTPERIRQIQEKAMRKLRHPSVSRRLISYLDLLWM